MCPARFLVLVCATLLQDDRYQSIAVLGLGLIAMNEDIGAEMALRSFGHLLQYGEEGIRRAVPLAMGLMCASNPKLTVLDTLSKLSHDADPEVCFGTWRLQENRKPHFWLFLGMRSVSLISTGA